MPSRRRNLLEAFRSADSAPLGGPRGPGEPAVGQEGKRPLPRALPALPGWLPWAVGVVVAFAGGVAVGRRTAGESRAAAPSAERVQGPRAAEGGARESAPERPKPADTAREPQRIEESPLFDPANRYTVVAGTYSQKSTDFAWAMYEHLRDEQLPVFPPVVSGDLVLVLVGAAPGSGELERLEAQVREVQEQKLGAKGDAYRSRIDSLIPARSERTRKETDRR